MARWPRYEHVFFDCDSTLTAIEGIDALAEAAGKQWRVSVLTDAAMNGVVELEAVYERRLRAVRPTRAQIREITRVYRRHVVEDAARTIVALQYLGHQVYVISGGLAEPVEGFAVALGIPRNRVRAVGITYNELSGLWWDRVYPGTEEFLHHDDGPLAASNGKADIIRELLAGQRGRRLLIGDGYSDFLAHREVDLFVGYGGVAKRQRVLDEAPIYIHCESLAPLIPLAGGPQAIKALRVGPIPYQSVALKATYLIQKGEVTFQDERLKNKFRRAFFAADRPAREAIYPRSDRSSSGDT